MSCYPKTFLDMQKDYLESKKLTMKNVTPAKLSLPEPKRNFPGDITNQPDPYGENPYYEE